jgi:hypothetical protein
MMPLLPTLSIAIGGNRADLRDLARGLDLLRSCLDFLDDGWDAEVDAVLQIHRVHAGVNQFCTFAQDRRGEHGPVAGSLVLEATSRNRFSNLSSSSISLATVTPSLVMRGAP